MLGNLVLETKSSRPFFYQIRVEGELDCSWVDWFGGMTIAPQGNGETLLTGAVVDQAALYGLLKRVRDLGMPLVSVNRVESGDTASSEVNRKTNSIKPIEIVQKGEAK